ncbi:MAG: YdcF family protein [Eubacteriales bacterium]|nr:YdcF family protein [Eubacteriales bacterium]
MYQLHEKQLQDITDYIFIEDELEKADAIWIPGCARPEHTEEAARLYREGYAPLLLPSGGFSKAQGRFQGVQKGGERYGTDFSCEADFLEAVLLKNGVPVHAIKKEREATYTLENAENTKKLLEKEGIALKKAILCCKAHHARRSHLYYSMVFPEVKILVHPTVVDGISRESWHQTEEGRRTVFGELSRMGQQLAMMEGRIGYLGEMSEKRNR